MKDKAPNLDSKTKDKISKLLQSKLAELTERISGHDKITTEALPKNSTEARSVKGEMDIVEALERHESGDILAIKKAIQKIATGDYGVCEGCGGVIGNERLLARPWSLLCVRCKESKEGK